MKLLCDELLRVLIRGLLAAVPKDFTGKTVIEVNWHAGTPGSTFVTIGEGQKLGKEFIA